MAGERRVIVDMLLCLDSGTSCVGRPKCLTCLEILKLSHVRSGRSRLYLLPPCGSGQAELSSAAYP